MRREKLEWLPLDKLVALKRNPQYCTPKQMESLRDSIKRDGFVSPVLVRPINGKRYEIVSGNHRVMAAREAGLTEAPCVVMKMDDRSAKRLAVNLNTIHGEPNAEILAPFLADLEDADLAAVHLEKDLLDELLRFDETLQARLAELQPPEALDRGSSGPIPDCTCSICGRRHVSQRSDVAAV